MQDKYHDIEKFLEADMAAAISGGAYLDDDLSEEELDLIERFSDRKFTAEELVAFDKRVRTEEAFKKRVNSYRVVNKLVEKKNTLQLGNLLKEQATEVRDSEGSKTTKTAFLNRKYMAIAATLLLVIVSSFLYQWYNQQQSSSELFITYYTIPTDNLRGDNSSLLRQAMDKYKQAKYEEAIQFFKQTLENQPDNMKAQYYLANSYLATGNAVEAIVQFQPLLRDMNDFNYESTIWYLALAYLKTDNIGEAKKQLKSIVGSTNSKYKGQAADLLDELKGMSNK